MLKSPTTAGPTLPLSSAAPRADELPRAGDPGRPAIDSIRLEAAWSFPGARQQDSGTSLKIAAVAAVLVHAALSLVRTPEPAPTASASYTQFETLIPIEELPTSPAAEPLEPQNEERDHPEHSPPRSIDASRAATASPEKSGDVQAEATASGPSSEELAAPLTTSDFGSSNFAMLSGRGGALGSGGLGRPGRGTGARPTSTTVSARDLSRSAIPPNLNALVQRNFPAAAKIARVGGTVTVSALIQTDGNPTDIRVVSVNPSGRGFGETCSRTIHEGPNWKPKLNAQGTPVASRERYTCHFKAPEGLPADVDGPTSGVGANRIWTKPAGG